MIRSREEEVNELSVEERIERLESAVGLLVLHIRGASRLTDDELAMIEEDLRKGAERDGYSEGPA